jgi:hypothetical protein
MADLILWLICCSYADKWEKPDWEGSAGFYYQLSLKSYSIMLADT